MKIPIKRKENKNLSKYLNEDLQIARKFAKSMHQEFGKFISSDILTNPVFNPLLNMLIKNNCFINKSQILLYILNVNFHINLIILEFNKHTCRVNRMNSS